MTHTTASGMDCNHEETSNLQLSEKTKLSVIEKHMPFKKRAWNVNLSFGSNASDEITKKEEFDLPVSQDVAVRCPRCEYVIPPKRLRGSDSFNVIDDQSKALSKEHGLEIFVPPGIERYIEDNKIESKCEESDLNLLEEIITEINGNVGGKELNAAVSEIDNGKNEPDNESMEITDPGIDGLNKDMDKGCIQSDEVWAVYDENDGMPRSYAWIRKVFFPGFRMRVTWLEAITEDQEISHVSENLPVCCGHFKQGKTEITDNIDLFSHSVVYSKDTGRSSFVIYPRKGETWALFKYSDIKWGSDLGTHNKSELDFVEILSDYTEGSGISVACLEKVKGGVYRLNEDVASFQIPPNELHRLSHMVPSHRMSGKECDDVPEGSFELDPASLPANPLEDMKDGSTLLQQRNSFALHAHKQPGASKRFGSFISRRQSSVVNFDQEQNQQRLDQQTFWTACPSCYMRYQYYTDVMNRSVQCPNCVKHFVAYDLGFENTANQFEGIDEQSTHHHQWRNTTYLGNKRPGVGKGFGSMRYRRDCQRGEQNYITRSTFWTACPFCHLKYKYYKDTLRRTIRCQNCRKHFIATL